jgi:Spy/CpxP family protein refolding chaperone
MRSETHWWWTHVARDAASAAAAAAECVAAAGCGPGAEGVEGGASAERTCEAPWFAAAAGTFGAGVFGLRGLLRFLSLKLGLDDAQKRELASILDELKTERAQAAVDHRRMSGALAGLLTEDVFDAGRVTEAAGLRVQSAERLRQATVRALDRTHRVLRREQRATLAMLIRTGAINL